MTANKTAPVALAYLDELIVREHSNLSVDLRKVREALDTVEMLRKEGRLSMELTECRHVSEAAAQLTREANRLAELRYHRECIADRMNKEGVL